MTAKVYDGKFLLQAQLQARIAATFGNVGLLCWIGIIPGVLGLLFNMWRRVRSRLAGIFGSPFFVGLIKY
jgi:hypothetical protein